MKKNVRSGKQTKRLPEDARRGEILPQRIKSQHKL
jgi:hypothetical protein